MIKIGDLYWLAGLLEGEGSFVIDYFSSKSPKISIHLHMTDEDVVRRTYSLLYMGNIYGPFKGTNKPIWKWDVNARDEVAQILMTIYPLMGERRKAKIKILLDAWKTIPYDTCLRGHRKYGKKYCDECRRQQYADKKFEALMYPKE